MGLLMGSMLADDSAEDPACHLIKAGRTVSTSSMSCVETADGGGLLSRRCRAYPTRRKNPWPLPFWRPWSVEDRSCTGLIQCWREI